MGEMQLEWKGHDKALSTRLWEYLNEEYLVDFNVTCHGQHMKVHKFIVALLFPILKESLRSTNTLSPLNREQLVTKSQIENSMLPTPLCLSLDNIADHAEDMDYLIQFAYTGKVTVPKEHADCIIHIAESMEVMSLKDSLDQWFNKSKLDEKPERNNVTPLSKLRPRTREENVIEEGIDLPNCNDDADFHSVIDGESNLSKSSDGMESDKSNHDMIIHTGKRNGTKEKLPQKRCRSKEDISKGKPIKRQTTTKSQQKLTKTDTEQTYDRDNEEKSLNCHQCNYVARYPHLLERHLKQHERKNSKGSKLITCRKCKKVFETTNLLDIHRDSKCGTEPLVCKYCGLKVNKKETLIQHIMAKHQVDAEGNRLEKNVKCPDCDFVCYARHQLRIHVRAKHERLNKLKCKECNYTAAYINHIMQHERIMHQNRKDYMCEECGSQFQTSGSLNHHVLVRHKGVKPHKCNVCSAEYSDRVSFKIHMQQHEGKVEYMHVCHICGHGFRRKFLLRLHLRKKHDIVLDEAKTTDTSCQLESASELTSTVTNYDEVTEKKNNTNVT